MYLGSGACVFIIRSVAEGITIIKMQRCAPVCGKV